MTVLNVTLPFNLINEIDDISKIINGILSHDITLSILKFSASSNGINLLLDLPEEKVKIITESLKENNVYINQKGRVKVDLEKCVYCGACVSLCPPEALFLDQDAKLVFSENKCIGCLLCIDSCPCNAIYEA